MEDEVKEQMNKAEQGRGLFRQHSGDDFSIEDSEEGTKTTEPGSFSDGGATIFGRLRSIVSNWNPYSRSQNSTTKGSDSESDSGFD